MYEMFCKSQLFYFYLLCCYLRSGINEMPERTRRRPPRPPPRPTPAPRRSPNPPPLHHRVTYSPLEPRSFIPNQVLCRYIAAAESVDSADTSRITSRVLLELITFACVRVTRPINADLRLCCFLFVEIGRAHV